MSGRLRGTSEQHEQPSWVPVTPQAISVPAATTDYSFPSHTPPHSLLTGSFVLFTCSLWLRECPDLTSGTSSACTGLTEDGEEHSGDCSWLLETILIKSLHSSCNATCWNANSFEDQRLLKNHSEQRSACAPPLSSLPVLLILQQRGGGLREKEDVSAFHMEIQACLLQPKTEHELMW